MALADDPSDRILRGEIAAAVHHRRPELEAELRHELALRNVERCFVKHLGGRNLTTIEMRRLRLALESYGPQRVSRTRTTNDGSSAA